MRVSSFAFENEHSIFGGSIPGQAYALLKEVDRSNRWKDR